jgi:hypothetical protein
MNEVYYEDRDFIPVVEQTEKKRKTEKKSRKRRSGNKKFESVGVVGYLRITCSLLPPESGQELLNNVVACLKPGSAKTDPQEIDTVARFVASLLDVSQGKEAKQIEYDIFRLCHQASDPDKVKLNFF